MSQTRQLAAIMFTDIVGYTALMGNDEQKAFTILKKNRELQKPIIEQFNGRWIKELGDGVLASFHSVSDAVTTAIKIQDACHVAKDFQLRIGIHLGEVVFENDDVFGDGVNIAARIQAAAPPGGILISETVQKIIANKKDLQTKFVREEALKNVKENVRLYEVITNSIPESGPSFQKDKNNAQTIPEKSIAVVPFTNMSNDPEQEYFSDGMTEEIINSLVHIQNLKVAGRMSSFRFKGSSADLREVGERLGVATVLEGSIRKQGNRLRVTAQLINVQDGFHLWSEKYDRAMDDIFAIQDEIAFAITEKLKITLFESEREHINKTPTNNKEAYELYLKGRFYLNRRGNDISKGLKYFEQSIALDVEFALAQTGYADACLLAGFWGLLASKEVMPKAKAAIEAAMRLDPLLSDPYASLGYYHASFSWNWEEAKKNYQHAIALNPNNPQTHFWYAMYLAWVEQSYDEAIWHTSAAIRLEPLSSVAYSMNAVVLFAAGKFEESFNAAKMGFELDPMSYQANRLLGNTLVVMKRYPEAIESLQRALEISNRFQWSVTDLIWAYADTGNLEEAKILMAELDERAKTEYVAHGYRGLAAAWMGDMDLAMKYLEIAYQNRDPIVMCINIPYTPHSLKQDIRFQELLKKIGLPE